MPTAFDIRAGTFFLRRRNGESSALARRYLRDRLLCTQTLDAKPSLQYIPVRFLLSAAGVGKGLKRCEPATSRKLPKMHTRLVESGKRLYTARFLSTPNTGLSFFELLPLVLLCGVGCL